jgi:hypothetical protein
MQNGQLLGKRIFKNILVNHRDNWRSKLGNTGWVKLMEARENYNMTKKKLDRIHGT